MITAVSKSNGEITVSTVEQRLTKKSAEFIDCFIHPKAFSLDPNIYTELVDHYTLQALCFPIKVMDWIPMDGSFSKGSPSATFTAAYTPINVKSIWALFRKNDNYIVNFENPDKMLVILSLQSCKILHS
ncbi:hypothetical protein TVAGG3_0943410 [Trichomonas vaginalis G3]|uniref:hypothetical protein n=1 Tax=Trichomonas vaginalis (strain ATCC PRA-98 / G3) TaxID=412133 RepID=UPI0021E56131|nr:hypothetical protein TVAGG3_0943410 [Trichomonas vaginalis G3]KAI5486698.1 hypothetical protein TVAGG3_0943410 [Trichomonas vaginalis G3]